MQLWGQVKNVPNFEEAHKFHPIGRGNKDTTDTAEPALESWIG